MKNVRWWVACLAIGALGIVALGCTPKPKCNASTCPGCCDSLGACQPGNTGSGCGERGNLCQLCAPSQACQLGICTLVNNSQCTATNCPNGCCGAGGCNDGTLPAACGKNGQACTTCGSGQSCAEGVCVGGGSDGGSDGGSACGPGTCAGCCAAGVCIQVNGQSASQCGTLGAACVNCGGSNSCNAGSCTGTSSCNASTCPSGCCYGSGASAQCLAGSSNTYCGTAGASCATCTGSQSCVGQTCTTSSGSCNASNCAGCCSGNSCLAGTSNGYCGKAGAACQSCSGSQSCQAQTCTTSSGSCNASNCAGCCSGNSCLAGTSNSSCGKAGAICQSCSGASCLNQTCTGSPSDAGTGAGVVGNTCTSAASCSGLSGSTCRLATALTGAGTYSDGYCTKSCGSDPSDCPSDAMCINFDYTDDEDGPLCTQLCTQVNSAPGDCRNGYACYGISGNGVPPNTGICWLYPPPQIDAGPPSDKVGFSCTGDTDCQYPPDDGFCISSTSSDGGASGFTNGYCSAPCEVDPAHCGTGGSCFGLGAPPDVFYACLALCTGPGTGQGSCNTGYVCDSYTQGDGGAAPNGICWPNCNNPNRGCSSGMVCQATGYCQ